jgi:3-deoxy-D-manno-octulosonic-acid transferase
MLCQAGGAKQVQGEAELYAYVEYILTHPEDGQSMGQKALQVLVSNRGALAQTVQALTDLLYQEYADLPAAQP